VHGSREFLGINAGASVAGTFWAVPNKPNPGPLRILWRRVVSRKTLLYPRRLPPARVPAKRGLFLLITTPSMGEWVWYGGAGGAPCPKKWGVSQKRGIPDIYRWVWYSLYASPSSDGAPLERCSVYASEPAPLVLNVSPVMPIKAASQPYTLYPSSVSHRMAVSRARQALACVCS
jgi:hypothetical protein